MAKKLTLEEREFLQESNAIEGERSVVAFEDAVKAWQYALSLKEINIDEILKIHKKLMRNLDPYIAGKIREFPVYIGGEKRDQSKDQIAAQLKDWCEKLWSEKTEEGIKSAHVVFEKIHPFADGNGRTGRIIMNLQRVKAGLPLLIIHAETIEQSDYYKWFKEDEK